MISSKWLKIVLVLALLLVGLAPAAAQDAPPPLPGELLLTDLGAPRALAFDADGNLLVAVAGEGGDTEFTMTRPDGEGTVGAGLSGRIVSIAPDGTASDLVTGLPSYAMGTEILGVYRVIPNGDSLWVVFSGTAAENIGAWWADTVVELNAKTLSVKRVINLNNIEATEDPDTRGYDTNVTDIAWGADGTLYITDAGGNDLLSWTEADGLQVVQAWPENPVPTSVEIAENGDLYIGFLGAGLAPGAAKIEHWSNGELVETFEGLTTVTDILLDGDTLYAVEMLSFTDAGPGAGRVVTVTADGATPVAEGLPTPFGITKGPDGALYVTIGTLIVAPGMTGGVVKLEM